MSEIVKPSQIQWLAPARDGRTAKQGVMTLAQSIKEISGGRLAPELVASAVMLEWATKRELQACSLISIVNATLGAARLGLVPGSTLGHAYLVPFGGACTLIVGYKGLVSLATRPGGAHRIDGHPVYEGDEFDYSYDQDGLVYRHKPMLRATAGKLLATYCVAWMRAGERATHLQVCDLAEIERTRGRSRAGNGGPWKSDYDAMALKTAARRLLGRWVTLTGEAGEGMSVATQVEAVAVNRGPALPAEVDAALDSFEATAAAVREEMGEGQSGGASPEIVDAAVAEQSATTRGILQAELNSAAGNAAAIRKIMAKGAKSNMTEQDRREFGALCTQMEREAKGHAEPPRARESGEDG